MKTTIESHKAWGTGDEIKFITLIAGRTSHREAFDGYVSSIGKRSSWGEIDKKRVMESIKMIQIAQVLKKGASRGR